MLRISCVLVLAAAACTGGDDSEGSQFGDECDGSADGCGQISVRWSITRASQTGVATCADVDAANVRVRATFQPDGRVATFTPACTSGATLTPRLPLGPYALAVDLLDAANAVVATEAANATIGVAGTVTEANVVFRVTASGGTGKLFGTCSASAPCQDPANTCATVGSVQMCTPACTATTAQTVCNGAAQSIDASLEQVGCFPTSLPSNQGFCFVTCDGAGGFCPGNLTCRDLGGVVRFVCAS